ncbi:MAG: tetratricopeptide repeat protein [Pseudomonadota bacterium]
MAAEEDVLLREVDEDLSRDQTFETLRKWRVPLIGGAVAIIGGVSGYQVFENQKTSAANEAAAAYAELSFAAETPPSADDLRTFSEETEGGYGALAALRAASELGAIGDYESAAELYAQIYNDESLSLAMRDYARVTAAYLLLDRKPDEAAAIAQLVETNAFRPYADEISSGAALKSGAYRAARAGFDTLAEDESLPEGLRARASAYAGVADAAANGASIEKPVTESDTRSFIDQFTSQLEQAGAPVNSITPDLLNLPDLSVPTEGEEPAEPPAEPEATEEPPQ